MCRQHIHSDFDLFIAIFAVYLFLRFLFIYVAKIKQGVATLLDGFFPMSWIIHVFPTIFLISSQLLPVDDACKNIGMDCIVVHDKRLNKPFHK